KDFDDLIEALNENYHFQLAKVQGGNGPSDQASFYRAKIPVIFFYTGIHPDYHMPSDTADKINVAGMRRVADLSADLIGHLAGRPERPQYVKVDEATTGRNYQVPRIGIIPAYGGEEEGLLLDGVAEGGAAAKAGLQKGDRIVEIGDKPVKDIQT